jgi:CRP/FNR family transcriptional regulator, cyclic AMP receptor protein
LRRESRFSAVLLAGGQQHQIYSSGNLRTMATGTYKVDLSKIWLFSSCSNKELNTIRKNLEAEITKPGKDLVKQGEIGQEFYLIVNGKASVKRNNRKAATLGPGDYFGELSLLDRRPRSATVTSETDMELLILGQRQFNGVLDTIPALSRKLLATMATRLRESDAKAFH